jgi:hypothetical protein
MPFWLFPLFIATVVTVTACAARIRRWWRKGCAGCIAEDLGDGSFTLTPHTCSRARTLYRDKQENVYEFGRRVQYKPRIRRVYGSGEDKQALVAGAIH